jgi:hypothetical protein
MTTFYTLRFETSSAPGGRSRYLYPSATRWHSYAHQALGSLFSICYSSQGHGGGIIRYSTAPPQGYKTSGRPQKKPPFPNNSSIAIEVCLPGLCIGSRSTIVTFVYFRGNLFTELLPNSERLLWLRYSAFEASYQNTKNTEPSRTESTAVPPSFNPPDSDRVGRSV